MSVPTITVHGRLGRDPQLRTSKSGRTYVDVFVIASARRFNKQSNQWEDGDRFAIGAVAFDDPQHNNTFATNIARSVHKGDAVIVTGRLRQNPNPNAPQGTPIPLQMLLDDIAPSLRRATATVVRDQPATQQQPQQTPQAYGVPTAPTEQAWGAATDYGTYSGGGDGSEAF